MKESGDEIKQSKSLKIQIGNSFLTITKPSATSDGDLVIEFSNGDKLTRIGSEWVINASSIKIGLGATLGAARLTDTTLIHTQLMAWLNTHTHPTAAVGPPSPPLVPLFGTEKSGTIDSASNKVKIE